MKSTTSTTARSWTEELPAERNRLVRLCARLTGNYDAAEDLAQEALYEAWRQAGNLRDESVWRSFVSGIARNVCLRWLRGQGKELSYRAHDGVWGDPDPLSAALESEAAADPFDVAEALEHAELARIIDRAMYLLSPDARELLVERYVDDLPQAEMAERRGMTENALGVRVHRAKGSLLKLLATPEFRRDAASYGLITPDSAQGWQETRLWCPRCGRCRLQGRFKTAEEEGDEPSDSPQDPFFAVRCPECDRALGYDFSSAHPALSAPRVLGDIRGFKPALNRLSAWYHEYYQTGLERGIVACPVCASRASLTTSPPIGTPPYLSQIRGLYTACTRCHRVCAVTSSGVAFHLPEVQQFWRNHPRMALLEEQPIVVNGRDAVLVRFASRTDSATLEVALAREDFRKVRVDQTAKRAGP